LSLLTLRSGTYLADPFFGLDHVALTFEFSVEPQHVPAAAFLVIMAPNGYTFVPRSFVEQAGFPETTGNVFIEGNLYVVQILNRILAGEVARCRVRVATPPLPPNIADFFRTVEQRWLLTFANNWRNPDTLVASSDYLTPPLPLKGSFGDVRVLPGNNGMVPGRAVNIEVYFDLLTKYVASVEGKVFFRIQAPIGFLFEAGCFSEPNTVLFLKCTGAGAVALLELREQAVEPQIIRAPLAARNPSVAPADIQWTVSSLIDVTEEEARIGAFAQTVELSRVPGYEVRALVVAQVGALPERGSPTWLQVWFTAVRYVRVEGSVEVHAPLRYRLSCSPKVQFRSLPSGSCTTRQAVQAGRTLANDVLAVRLTSGSVEPNQAYEFAVAVRNPEEDHVDRTWGLVFLSSAGDVLDSNMHIAGYELYTYGLSISLQPTTSVPGVVNYIFLRLILHRAWEAGEVEVLRVISPPECTILCLQYQDVTEGGKTEALLPTTPQTDVRCIADNMMELQIDPDVQVGPAVFRLRLGVINPSSPPLRDVWAIELRTLRDADAPLWHGEVAGFGVWSSFDEVLRVLPLAGAPPGASLLGVVGLAMLANC
jgi:hypothetical protein